LSFDDIFSRIAPYKKKPKRNQEKKVEEILQCMGLRQGRIYTSNRSLVWVYGDVTNPEWMGQRSLDKTSFTMVSSPGDIFFFVDYVLLRWYDELEKRTYWLYCFKFIVNDKVVYFPIPSKIHKNEIEDEIKNLFCEAV